MKKIILIIALLAFPMVCFGQDTATEATPKYDKQYCLSLKEQIQEKIDSANYCEVDEDCIATSFNCPFGCSNYLNKDFDISEIKQDLEVFRYCPELHCEYDCEHPLPPACVKNKCVGIQCEPNKEYGYNECECPEGTVSSKVYSEEKKAWFYVCKPKE